MTLLAENARNILREALSSERGITVEIEPTAEIAAPALRAKQVLYRFKSEDYEFRFLQICLSPDKPDTELWIIKRDVEVE